MKRVLIADDEYLVRVGLRTTVDWLEHGFEIVGEASNGKEAVALFEKTDPDILLTDIKMPVMDGLELIEILKEKKPSLHVIILSNHNDFTYAQKAMKLGAKDYLLKSDLSQNNILQTLKHAVLSSVPEADTLLSKKEENPLRDYLRSYLLSSKEVYKIPLPEYAFQSNLLVAIICKCNTAFLPLKSQPMFYRFMQSLFNTLWPDIIVISAQRDDIFSAALIVSLEKEEDFSRLAHKAKLAGNNIRQYYNTEFHIGISLPDDKKQLPLLLRHATIACNSCFYTKNSFSIYQQDFSPLKESIQIDQKWIGDLIATNDFERLRDYIIKTFHSLSLVQNHSLTEEVLTDFLSCARQLVIRYPFLESHFQDQEKLSYTGLSPFKNIDDCMYFMLDVFSTIANALMGKSDHYSSVINQIIDYIHQHHQENISLSDIADLVSLSKSHLSLLFKQETGINFSRYLMDYRIDKAKELFENTNLHIYEVAEKVGIPNPYYFSKVFKENTGFSCRSYKNKLQPSD